MGLIKYSEPDLRGLLARAIKVRWPAEQLVVLTSCHKVSADRAYDLTSDIDLAGAVTPRIDPGVGAERGFLAVTQSRLIFQEEVSGGLLLRAISIIIGVLPVAVLFFGDGLGSFLPMAAMSLVLWGVAKVLEMLLVARADIEFGQVGKLDSSLQRIEGTARNGILYRLGVPDPSDFLLVAALVQGRAAA
jgi:hypothetical protein